MRAAKIGPLMVLACALVLHISACRQPQSQEERLAAEERRIEAKIKTLKDRQRTVAEKLEAYERRLAKVHQRREQLQDRQSPRTPAMITPGQER